MRNDNMGKIETLRERRELLSILCEAVETLERSQKYLLSDYRPTGEKEQRKDSDGNLLYNEDGSPDMKDIWASVELKYEELSTDNKARYDAYTTAINLISKLG